MITRLSGTAATAKTTSSQPGSASAAHAARARSRSRLAIRIQPGENGATGSDGTPGRLTTTILVVPSRLLISGSARIEQQDQSDADERPARGRRDCGSGSAAPMLITSSARTVT